MILKNSNHKEIKMDESGFYSIMNDSAEFFNYKEEI